MGDGRQHMMDDGWHTTGVGGGGGGGAIHVYEFSKSFVTIKKNKQHTYGLRGAMPLSPSLSSSSMQLLLLPPPVLLMLRATAHGARWGMGSGGRVMVVVVVVVPSMCTCLVNLL
jgi:hypothetical protein